MKNSTSDLILIAIDVAKAKHDILIEFTDGRRKALVIRNNREDFDYLVNELKKIKETCLIGFEPTADYHRPIAYFLQKSGFKVCLLSSIAVARTREALNNSWDKNDSKDAQVMIHLMKNQVISVFHDPMINDINDLQELSNTHFQVSRQKTKLQHSIINHYLAIYFPEAEKFFCSSRATWFGQLLIHYPSPAIIKQMTEDEFIKQAAPLLSSKQNKGGLLSDFYKTAVSSIGVPFDAQSDTASMFRVILNQHYSLCKKRDELEDMAHKKLKNNRSYQILRSVPGIGPIIALTVLAEAGDLKRFKNVNQFLSFCGLNLCTHQSGTYRSSSAISKRGNARLRSALWIASTVAIKLRENTFREKFNRCVKTDPNNKDLKRKAYTAVTIKLARVLYFLIKNDTIYRPYFDGSILSGRTCSDRAVEAAC